MLLIYEETFGKLINKGKSNFMMHSKASVNDVDRVKMIMGFSRKDNPITYLGCPLYIGHQRIIYFTRMVAKVFAKIKDRQTKMLNYGERATLIKLVLQSLPIHIVSGVSPTSTTLKKIKSLIADLFWGWAKEKKKYHWDSWETLSFPYEEGDIGVKNLDDVCLTLQYRQ